MMEDNVADALKMAADVLLFVVALTISISSFTQAQDTLGTINLNDQEVMAFNNKLIPYQGNIRGSQLKQLFEVVKSNNASATAEGADEKQITITGVTEDAIKSGATYNVKMTRNETTALITTITVTGGSTNNT